MASGEMISTTVDTLPKLMLRNAEQYGARPAMREKDRGIWQTHTWTQYRDQVRDLALGLAALGFRRGDRLSVIGDNRPRLYWAQVAAMSLGGISVPVYQDSIAKELAYVWNHAEVSVIIAEDQEQVDKVLTLKAELPAVRLVVYDDPRGMLTYRHEWLKSYGDVQELGRERARQQPQLFEHEISAGRPDEVAIICYTSGTTGSPKGAMLTHANAISVAATSLAEGDVRSTDEYLAYLPMAWAGDATYTLFASLAAGFTVSCPESPETVQRDLPELGPSTLMAPPRIWANMLTGRLGRPALSRHRGAHRRQGRGARARRRRLQGLLQERGGHARSPRWRRLVSYGRRRLHGPARPPGHHRSGQGRGRAQRGHALRAPVHREQAEVQSVYPGSRRLRQRSALRG